MKYYLKSLCLSLLVIGPLSAAFAQDDNSKVSSYLFPDFTEATIKKAKMTDAKMNLNYNTATLEMVYWLNNQYNILPSASADTIFIAGRAFLPVGKEFYELATLHVAIPLFIQYTCEVRLPQATSSFGNMQSTTTVSADHLTLDQKAQLYDLKLGSNMTLSPQIALWLKKDGQFVKANNIKQVQAAFPKNADKIKAWYKQNNTNFDKPDDVKNLIIYCNSLPK
jgi:Tfp pilus assembly protein PilE